MIYRDASVDDEDARNHEVHPTLSNRRRRAASARSAGFADQPLVERDKRIGSQDDLGRDALGNNEPLRRAL